jgi:hypothetical protein
MWIEQIAWISSHDSAFEQGWYLVVEIDVCGPRKAFDHLFYLGTIIQTWLNTNCMWMTNVFVIAITHLSFEIGPSLVWFVILCS